MRWRLSSIRYRLGTWNACVFGVRAFRWGISRGAIAFPVTVTAVALSLMGLAVILAGEVARELLGGR